MTTIIHNPNVGDGADIKQVPQACEIRAAIRAAAVAGARALDPAVSPSRDLLESAAGQLLADLALPRQLLGFAMVCLDDAFWASEFQSVPFTRRLLLLPKCLSRHGHCPGTIDSVGLNCAGCGACEIAGLKSQAEDLGYEVIVAEGTSSVVMRVLEGKADAVLGVACLDSLEKSFERIADLGIAHQAIPLLTDGCVDTTAEVELIRETLVAHHAGGHTVQRSYLPLLRAARALFEPDALQTLLSDCACPPQGDAASQPAMEATDQIARDWLRRGGKRLRPFITMAAYAVGKYGPAALSPTADAQGLLPRSVRQMALAIEALHKASLVHDDIEDRDAFRYGEPTIHQRHGVPVAINVGDYLVGLGYRLVASQADELGAACTASVLQRLSAAQLQLCCGQGTELVWNRSHSQRLRPVHALQIGALKTAPAFEVALFAGLQAAGVNLPMDVLAQFSSYIGEGYQVLNDLEDWEEEGSSKGSPGRDFAAGRPTILQAFACEVGGAEELAALADEGKLQGDPDAVTGRAREVYARLGAFDKAELLYDRLRQRALELAGQLGDPAMQELLRFLARNVLRKRYPTPRPDGG